MNNEFKVFYENIDKFYEWIDKDFDYESTNVLWFTKYFQLWYWVNEEIKLFSFILEDWYSLWSLWKLDDQMSIIIKDYFKWIKSEYYWIWWTIKEWDLYENLSLFDLKMDFNSENKIITFSINSSQF